MSKAGKVILTLIIILVIAGSALGLCYLFGAFSIPETRVYELFTTQNVTSYYTSNTKKTLTENSEAEEDAFDVILAKPSYQTLKYVEELKKVNKIKRTATNVIDEYVEYCLFVQDRNVNDKNLTAAVEEYKLARSFTEQKFIEIDKANSGADFEGMFKILLDRYCDEVVKYNKVCTQLVNYVNKACFKNNLPKTQIHCTLDFIYQFSNFLITKYVAEKDFNNNLYGITENEQIFEQYLLIKAAGVDCNTEIGIKFVSSYYDFVGLKDFLDAYNFGSEANLRTFVNTSSNFQNFSANVKYQQECATNICNYIVQTSFVA